MGIISKKTYYDEQELLELRESVNSIGTDIDYYADVWCCDKLFRNPSDGKEKHSIYFINVANLYKILIKDFCLIQFKNNKGFGGVRECAWSAGCFLAFLESQDIELKNINPEVAISFKKYIKENKAWAINTKHKIWITLRTFMRVIKKMKNSPKMNYFEGTIPFKKVTRQKNKYIDKTIVRQMDKAFENDARLLYLQLVYWLLRLIPSRIGEILGMQIDCLKPAGPDTWVIFIPTWKQNGGYKEAQIRRIYMKYEGKGKFLMDLIRQQQKVAISNQNNLKKDMPENLLFTHRVTCDYKRSEIQYKKAIVGRYTAVTTALNNFLIMHNVKDEDGNQFLLRSHQLRHNGITDRLYYKFTSIQVRLMTEHQSIAMIEEAYNHPNKEHMVETQRKLHDDNNASNHIFFRGRILNMNESTEKRLLRNIRSRKIKNLGICEDFINCKCFQCLDCDFLILDADNLPYFQEQVREFEEKLKKVGEHKFLKENIEYNIGLYRKAIDKIYLALELEGVIDEGAATKA